MKRRVRKVFTTAGVTWVCPAGVTRITIWGRPGSEGGFYGGNGGTNGATSGGGGGAGGHGGVGARSIKQIIGVTPGVSYLVTAGAAGAGGVRSTATAPTPGGASLFQLSAGPTTLVTWANTRQQLNSISNGAPGSLGVGGGGGTLTSTGGVAENPLLGDNGGLWHYDSTNLGVIVAGPAMGGSGGAGGGTSTSSVAGREGAQDTLPASTVSIVTGGDQLTGGLRGVVLSVGGIAGSSQAGGGGGGGGYGGYGDDFPGPTGLSELAGAGSGGAGGVGGLPGGAAAVAGAAANAAVPRNGRGGGGGGGGGGQSSSPTGGVGQGGNGGSGSPGIMILEWFA